MTGESKQQKNQDQYEAKEGNENREQKQNTGFGDKKLNGPDVPST